MSRCFPFPPPGYEKKPGPEDADLLKEEKRKEKKHKEKKDKEGKEKRDKERSDGKHREKKEKKDKHRDKKEKNKDKKDKDKDKEKSGISEEARVAVPSGASSGQKLPRGDEHVKNESINSHGQHGEKLVKTSLPAVETEESKFVLELARRINNDQKGQLAERFPVESKWDGQTNSTYVKGSGNLAQDKEEKNKETRVYYSNKMDGPTNGMYIKGLPGNLAEDKEEKNKEKRVYSNKMDVPTNSMYVKGFPGNLAEDKEEKNKEKQVYSNKMDGTTNSMYVKGSSGNLAEDKEAKNKEKRVYSNKIDGQPVRVEPRIGVNAIHPSFPEMAKSKYHGMPRPLEENVEKRAVEKEKSKERHDEKSREKKKDKKKEKEKKKEEKVKDKSSHRKSKQDTTSRDINKKNDFVGVSNTSNQVPLVPKDNTAGTVTEGILGKRKDVGTNGFLHESEVRPAKLLRPTSSHQSPQNGKRLETHQKADTLLPSNTQGVVVTDNHVLKKERSVNGTIKLSNRHGVAPEEKKEDGANGTIKDQPLAMSKPKASPMSPGADEIAKASRRPPHPDSKYLNQVLSVPKMDKWTGFDDQEWLFGNRSSLVRKKPDMCLDEVKDNRVWSEALQIDSADVCALPYVIPY